jgi:hypothetical protein
VVVLRCVCPTVIQEFDRKQRGRVAGFFGSDYDEDDVVIVDGRPGRITRVGLTKTVFYLYTCRHGVLVGGTKLAVANTALSNMRIEKQLEKLEADDYWKVEEGPNGSGKAD